MSDQDAVTRLNAALEGRYRVERQLGEGGMATVFLARDERHNRNVALKVLKPELAAVVGADRFLAEIETTANLQHPHILPLFDSGEADGFLFYVMPYVEGESLRERLDREHQLPVDEAVQIATKVAGAVQAAHDRGVIHRDIKPANILLSKGEPLVSDFGIALAVGAAGGGRLTETGLSLGTPRYMSPEQATGDRPLDARSDVFSLGAVLYEVLAGEPPHTGRTTPAVMAKLLSERPTPLRIVRETVPEHVEVAVARSLAKLPADRYGSAKQFADALLQPLAGITQADGQRSVPAQSWSLRPLVAIGTSLAVVGVAGIVGVGILDRGTPLDPDKLVVAPFENRTGDPALDEVGLYVSEQIMSGVARSGMLRVPPSATVRQVWSDQAAGEALSATDLAEQLEASTVVSGSYALAGGSLTFQAEIIDTGTGDLIAPLDPVSVPGDSVSSVIAPLGENVLTELASRRESVSSQRQSFSAPLSWESFREDERGLEYFNRLEWEEALASFERAFELDSTNAHAVLYVANSLANLGRRAEADSVLGRLEPIRDRLNMYDRAYEAWLRSWYFTGDLRAEEQAAQTMFRTDANATTGLIVAMEALRNNRPAEAVGYLSRFAETPAAARNGLYWDWFAQALHSLGEYQRQLDVVRQAPRPNRLLPPDEVAALAALGRLDDLAQVLDGEQAGLLVRAARELRVHGYPDEGRAYLDRALAWYRERPPEEDIRFELAQALYEGEQWEDAGALFDELVAETPDNLDLLGWHGVSLARRGARDEAVRVSRQLGDLDRPYLRGRHTLWRARIATVLGDGEAVRLIEQANREGVAYGTNYHLDKDFDSLRSNRSFQELVRPKG